MIRRKNFRKIRIIHIGILLFISLFIQLFPVERGMFFGSEGDWLTQHVAIADSLRQTILETGSFFPQYIHLGGGSNIYDFAYYGLFRLDILVSCLFPNIEMKYFVGGYALIGVVVSTAVCYLWLCHRTEKIFSNIEEREKFKIDDFGVDTVERNKNEWKAFWGAFLFACSSCFYQAHHQIMFVNYMPFLLLALIGVDWIFKKKNHILLTIALFGIYMHSFYYSISCLTVILLYIVYNMTDEYDSIFSMHFWREEKGREIVLSMAGAIFLSIGMAVFLLLPVGMDILSTVKDGGRSATQGIGFISLNMEGLLYSPYGCGMTILILYLFIYALKDIKMRWLSMGLLLIMVIPMIPFALNGFLYAQVKILIPFLPLLVLVASEELYKMREMMEFPVIPAFLCFLVAVFSSWRAIVLIDTVFLLMWIYICRFFAKKEIKKRGKRGRFKVFYFVFFMPLLFSIGVNSSDSYLKQLCDEMGISASKRSEGYVDANDKRQEHFTKEELEREIDTYNYRLDTVANTLANINMLYSGKIHRTTMYSSITNNEYAKFYYDIMHNAIAINNRVALMQGNSLFNWWMGVRYLIVEKGKIPTGYKVLREKGNYLLVENKAVFPICYGITNQEEIENALDSEKAKKNWRAKFKKESINSIFSEEELENLLYPSGEREHYKIPLRKNLSGKILMIQFLVKQEGKEAVEISIQGVKNKLSGENAPYPNGNEKFTYLISVGEDMDELEVWMSSGDYSISNMVVYTADEEEVKDRKIIIGKTVSGEGGEEKREKKENEIYVGEIEMPEDGYFMTTFPYRDGYQVKVDGENRKAQKINMAFLGIPMEKGRHEVCIQFIAPGYRVGVGISIVAWGIFGGDLIMRKKRRK